VKASILAIGLLLAGLSIIPLVYGYSITVSPATFGICQSCGTGYIGSVAIPYLIIGGVLLAVGLALSGYGFAENGERQGRRPAGPD
jgi:hypothetical protein